MTTNTKRGRPIRNLVIVLGDQLDPRSAALDDFDRECDIVWMAEVDEESTHVWTHKARIVMFLASMRSFCRDLQRRKFQVEYRKLDDRINRGNLPDELAAAVKRLQPEKLIMVQPGEWRVQHQLMQTAEQLEVELEVRDDRHFFSTPADFAEHAAGRKQLRLEYFLP